MRNRGWSRKEKFAKLLEDFWILGYIYSMLKKSAVKQLPVGCRVSAARKPEHRSTGAVAVPVPVPVKR